MTSPYPLDTINTIPARSGVAVPLKKSQTIKVINTHGTQVIDFWAFSISTLIHHLSMSHTRASTLHLSPLVGDILTTNKRESILQLVADTTPGVHDTLIAACDVHRYHQLGVPEDQYHNNCADNLRQALARDVSKVMPEGLGTPDPLNLFMNIPVVPRQPSPSASSTGTAGADIVFDRPVSQKGQSVTFRALMDCIVVMSACPQDLVKVNDMNPTEAHFVVQDQDVAAS